MGALHALHPFLIKLGGMTGVAGLGRRRRVGHIMTFLYIFDAFKPNSVGQHRAGRRAEGEVVAVTAIPYMMRRLAGVVVEVTVIPLAGVVVVADLARVGHVQRNGLLYGLGNVRTLVEVDISRTGGPRHTETN
ncbi:MAG: hypothetical protein A2081_02590 [Elusimicrobia bacterium GWC2_61_19]|nr:MAG: hypothetical protein A2081_02590 [Elusimicrobia bacterium GWC2_61_19]